MSKIDSLLKSTALGTLLEIHTDTKKQYQGLLYAISDPWVFVLVPPTSVHIVAIKHIQHVEIKDKTPKKMIEPCFIPISKLQERERLMIQQEKSKNSRIGAQVTPEAQVYIVFTYTYSPSLTLYLKHYPVDGKINPLLSWTKSSLRNHTRVKIQKLSKESMD